MTLLCSEVKTIPGAGRQEAAGGLTHVKAVSFSRARVGASGRRGAARGKDPQ